MQSGCAVRHRTLCFPKTCNPVHSVGTEKTSVGLWAATKAGCRDPGCKLSELLAFVAPALG